MKTRFHHVDGAPDLLIPIHCTAKIQGIWTFRGFYPDGTPKFLDEGENTFTAEGLTHMLAATLDGAVQISDWRMGMLGTTPTISDGDTLASISGQEWQSYSGGPVRPSWGNDTAANKSSSNSTPVTFTSTANSQVVGGGFICSVSAGTSGILLNGKAFNTGDKNLDNLESIEVTAILNLAST